MNDRLISTDYTMKSTVFHRFFSQFNLSNIGILFNHFCSDSNHDITAFVHVQI